jgi:hypothetical protein
VQHIEMLLGVETEGVGALRRPQKSGTVRLTNTAPALIVIVLQASSFKLQAAPSDGPRVGDGWF